jgi:hypothetical protein
VICERRNVAVAIVAGEPGPTRRPPRRTSHDGHCRCAVQYGCRDAAGALAHGGEQMRRLGADRQGAGAAGRWPHVSRSQPLLSPIGRGVGKFLGPRPARDRQAVAFFRVWESPKIYLRELPNRIAVFPGVAATMARTGHYWPLCAPLEDRAMIPQGAFPSCDCPCHSCVRGNHAVKASRNAAASICSRANRTAPRPAISADSSAAWRQMWRIAWWGDE